MQRPRCHMLNETPLYNFINFLTDAAGILVGRKDLRDLTKP